MPPKLFKISLFPSFAPDGKPQYIHDAPFFFFHQTNLLLLPVAIRSISFVLPSVCLAPMHLDLPTWAFPSCNRTLLAPPGLIAESISNTQASCTAVLQIDRSHDLPLPLPHALCVPIRSGISALLHETRLAAARSIHQPDESRSPSRLRRRTMLRRRRPIPNIDLQSLDNPRPSTSL